MSVERGRVRGEGRVERERGRDKCRERKREGRGESGKGEGKILVQKEEGLSKLVCDYYKEIVLKTK